MSRIKFILFWLGAFCITNLSFGQQPTMPSRCSSTAGNISIDGDFTISPEYGCLDFTNNSATAYVQNGKSPSGGSNGLAYIFNFKDGDALTFPTTPQTSITVNNPGVYWVLQGGNENGSAFIACRSFEVIKTEQPDIKVSSCGTDVLTVTFLDTPKNRTHGGYRIVWGDGEQDFIPNVAGSQFDIPHTYLTPPTSKPQIVAIYTRGASNFEACRSTPYPFNADTNNPPKISELEGLTSGTSNKITMVEGADGKAYTLEQKPKNGNWADTGIKITRNTGEIFKTETVTGLNVANEYCFRLKTTDACSNDILSNEVCTIIPKANVISPSEVKLDWNSPDPAVTRYSIGYSESPTGANPNNASPVTPTATTYTFNALDCRKLYDFQVTAFIETTPADRVVIKSPTILVNPATTPSLAPLTIGTVSVENSNLIRFNILPLAVDVAPANYIFYRSEGGGNNFVQVKTTTDNFYEDRSVEPTKQQYCYKVEYQDACGNTSEQSDAFCSVFLTSKQTNTLNWTPYIIQSSNTFPVEYYIQSIDNNNTFQTINLTTNTSENVKQQIDDLLDLPNSNGEAKFVIKAVQKIAVTLNSTPTVISLGVSSNEYIFITPARLYIPTAFSPNGDGFNDDFIAKGRYIEDFNLEIYDRWGNIIFESTDLNTGWNGTSSGGTTPAPAGNYGFKIFGLDTAGQKFEKVGSVTLIR